MAGTWAWWFDSFRHLGNNWGLLLIAVISFWVAWERTNVLRDREDDE